MILPGESKNVLYQNKWNGLGGKFDGEETPEECAKREVFEESGYVIEKLNLKELLTFPKVDGENDWYSFVFTSSEFTGDQITSKEGELKWVPDDKILEQKLWEGDYIFIPWIQQDKFFSAKFTYNNGELISHSVTFHIL